MLTTQKLSSYISKAADDALAKKDMLAKDAAPATSVKTEPAVQTAADSKSTASPEEKTSSARTTPVNAISLL